MPTLWFAKDGPRPYSQSGPGVAITNEEAQLIVGTHQAKYVGLEAPSINSDSPSHSTKNVLLEVKEEADTSTLLPKVGFYLVLELVPYDAKSALDAHRDGA